MNIFIVESSIVRRASLRAVLSDMAEVRVVGQAGSKDETIERIGSLLPEVIIMNLELQPEWEICILENIKACHVMIKVIVVSHYFDDLCIERCKRAGADYFFNLSSQFMELRKTLHELRPRGLHETHQFGLNLRAA